MEPDKQKDALTELIDEADSQTSSSNEPNNGVVSAPAGDKVNLDLTPEVIGLIEFFRRRRAWNKQKQEVSEWLVKKNLKEQEEKKKSGFKKD